MLVFPVTPKEKEKRIYFRDFDNTTEDIKQRLEQTDYMIYRSIQNVLVTDIIRRKLENKFNQIAPFYQGDLVKKKNLH